MKIPIKQNLILVLAIVIFLFLEIGVFSQINDDSVLLAQLFGKKVKLASLNGGEEIKSGETININWASSGVDKVGIVLFNGKEPQWIVKNIEAKSGKFEWTIVAWQEPSQDYKIAVFEYPWKKGNKIAYSNKTFTIIGPKFAACDNVSVTAEYPYIASDFPNLRRVFITSKRWGGNLGGLDGADAKCQEEAQRNDLTGTWKAFLGDDESLAIERLKLDGMFVEAGVAATLPSGETCHRLLGENFDKFLEKFSNSWVVNNVKLNEDFLKNLGNLWFGKIKDTSAKECITIVSDYPSRVLAENYSFTTTCENWTREDEKILGYPPIAQYTPEYPKCYTSQGTRTNAVGQAGLASGLAGNTTNTSIFTPAQGKGCDALQRLLCIEQ